MLVTGAFLILFGALCSVEALDNGLALTPPMAWNTYHAFGCNRNCDATADGCVGETQMMRTADQMVSEGYLATGYQYLVIDGCWDTEDGRGVPDPRRFPNGMKALADYIHEKGLKFGILGDLSMSEFNADVAASWGVDYFEAIGYQSGISEGYIKMSQRINGTSRPMIVACSWPYLERMAGKSPNYEEASQYCNTWRIHDDIRRSWSSVHNVFDWVGDHQDDYASLAGPGHWNDPDRLMIGNPELTVEQAQIHMALWSVMAAPLILSVDLANVKPEFKDILLNQDIIAVDQDKLGLQGRRVYKNHGFEVWTRKLSDGCYAIAFVNLGSDIGAEIFEVTHKDMKLPQLPYVVKDLYHVEKERLLQPDDNFTVYFLQTVVRFYKFIPY